MRDYKLAGGLILLLTFCLSGCASLHVDIGSTLELDKVSSVILQEPAKDPWQLSPAIRTELQEMGLTVLNDDKLDPDLLVRFSYGEGPDLNTDGDLTKRLSSLHIQFVDPATEQNVAVADYFYAQDDSEDPQDGVLAAFAGLRQALRRNEIAGPQAAPLPVAQFPSDSPATTPAIPQKEEAAAVVSPATAPQSLAGSSPAAPSQRPRQETAITGQQSLRTAPVNSTVDQVPSAGAATGVTTPSLQGTATPTSERTETETRRITPKTESPWIPRFQSWGFENWGEQADDGY